jgi:hypothetical protein
MRGLDPRIHQKEIFLRWIAGSSPAMTRLGKKTSPPAHGAFDLTVRLVGRQKNVVVVIEPERRKVHQD